MQRAVLPVRADIDSKPAGAEIRLEAELMATRHHQSEIGKNTTHCRDNAIAMQLENTDTDHT